MISDIGALENSYVASDPAVFTDLYLSVAEALISYGNIGAFEPMIMVVYLNVLAEDGILSDNDALV